MKFKYIINNEFKIEINIANFFNLSNKNKSLTKMNYSHVKSLMINIILNFKKKFPNSSQFVTIFLFLKFNGILSLINPFEHKYQSSLTTYNLFHSFTFYAGLTRPKLNPIPYIYLCSLIYFIVLVPLLLCLIIFFKHGFMDCKKRAKKKNKHNKEIEYQNSVNISNKFFKEIQLSKFEKKTLNIVLCFFIFICFLSQHLVEILAFCYGNYINKNKLNAEYSLSMERSKYLSLTIVNSLFIIIINLYLVSFYILLNNKSFYESSIGFTHFHNHTSLFIMLIIFNSQTIHYYPTILLSQTFNIICIISCEICLFVLIILYIKSYGKNNYYSTVYIFFVLFAFFSGIISSIIQISNTLSIININSYGNYLFILKIVVNVLFTYVSYILIRKYQHVKYDRVIACNLFAKNKNISTSEYIYRLIEILDDMKSNTIKSIKFCSLIAKHTKICTNQDKCTSYLLDIETMLIHLKNNAISKKNETHIFDSEDEFINEFLMIVLFIENEISNLISSIHIRRRINNNFDILLLHCSFVFFYEKNVTYALYLLENYLSKIKHIPFEYLIHFIELKKLIIKYDNNKKRRSNNLFVTDCKFHSFYLYYKDLEQIKSLLYHNCVHYQKLIYYKSIYTHLQTRNRETKNEASINKNQKNLLDKIFYACITITKTTQSLKKKLYLNYSNKLLSNPEICYLLTIFFELTDKSALVEMEKYFTIIESYDQIEMYENSYSDVEFEHPLIFGMNDNIILYISEKLSENLLYTVNELKGNDVNILLPSLFNEYHSIEMKRNLLIKQTSSIKKNVFILDKEKYVRKAFLHGGPLLTFNNHLLVICDISIIDDNMSDDYLFILNSSMEIIAHTRDFEEKYKITTEMCSKLKLNFCSIFNISYDQIFKKYKTSIDFIRKRNFSDIKELIRTFCYCDFNFIVNAYSEEPNNIYNLEMKLIKNKIVLMHFADRVKNNILEEKTDNDWKERIEYIKELIKKENNNIFEISISLHHFANYPYFQAKIIDKDKYNYLNFNLNIDNSCLIKTTVFYSSPKNIHKRRNTRTTSSNKNIGFVKITPRMSCKENVNTSNLSIIPRNLWNESTKKGSSKNTVSFNTNNNNNTHTDSSAQQMLNCESSQRLHLTSAFSSYDNNEQLNNKNVNLQEKSSNSSLVDIDQNQETIALYFRLKFLTKIEKYLLYICYISIGLVTIINILSYIVKIGWIGELENFIHINVYIVKLKQYLLDVSINLSQGCYIADNITTGTVDNVSLNHVTIKLLISAGSNNLFVAYKNLQDFIANYTNEPLIQEINSILYEPNEYTFLNTDFSITKYNSSLDEQLHYYHYATGILGHSAQSFDRCRVKDLFVYKNLTQSSKTNATDSEKVLYYISKNLIIDFFDKTDRMISRANNFLSKRENHNFRKTQAYNISLIILGCIICFCFFFIVIIYQNKITTHLKQFFTFHNKSGMFEIQLELYRKVIQNLDYTNSYKYENARKQKKKSFTHKNSKLKNKISTKELSSSNSMNSTLNFQQKLLKTFHNQKSIKNYTRFKSMYHHKKKDKEELNIPINQITINNNLTIFSIKDFSFSFFAISMITKSLTIILLCLICHLGISLANFFEDKNIFTSISLATQLSFYYLDKVPAHIEVLLDHRFALLENNILICSVPFENYSYYLPDYGLSPEEIESQLFQDEKFLLMGQSQMTILYFRINMQNSIIKKTEEKESKPVLPLRYKFSKKLKLKEGICEIVTEEYVKGGFKMFEGYNETYNVYACHHLGQGAADNGYINSMASFMLFLQDEFIDFIKNYKLNKNSPNELIPKLSTDLFLRIYYQFTFLYTPSWIVTADLVQKDIIDLFTNLKTHEVFFYVSELIICAFYYLVFGLVIMQLLRKKESYFGEIIANLSVIID